MRFRRDRVLPLPQSLLLWVKKLDACTWSQWAAMKLDKLPPLNLPACSSHARTHACTHTRTYTHTHTQPFTSREVKLIKQQQKLLEKLEKKANKEAERRRKQEAKQRRREEDEQRKREGRKKVKRPKVRDCSEYMKLLFVVKLLSSFFSPLPPSPFLLLPGS